MSKGYIIEWLKAAGIRAIKTRAQTAIGMIAVGAAFHDIDWLHVLSVVAVAGILSILTSLAGLPEVDKGQLISKEQDAFNTANDAEENEV